ncbi:hypothetical protein EVAR_25551_1 [Eumeta japonica]|uniref:Uncharacterized protein n=1 Tax=Eumeta variegata TaxID=151549 RepID=A0A4C1Z4Y1_EUMVA|nr:hypothetical protein EVAR_25551_1 [Eumeta japonica]
MNDKQCAILRCGPAAGSDHKAAPTAARPTWPARERRTPVGPALDKIERNTTETSAIGPRVRSARGSVLRLETDVGSSSDPGLICRGETASRSQNISTYITNTSYWAVLTVDRSRLFPRFSGDKTDGEGDIDDDEAIDWSNSDEENENIDDNDEN